MTVAELARAYGVTRWRAWKMIQQGRLDQWVKAIEVNGRTYYEIDPEAVHHKPTDLRRKESGGVRW